MTGKLGRDIVFDYLRDLGVACLFGVPGTNEIPLIDARASTTKAPDSSARRRLAMGVHSTITVLHRGQHRYLRIWFRGVTLGMPQFVLLRLKTPFR
jgi:hypothetical protein